MNQIKCIFFDLGWTLLEPCSGDWLFSHKFYEMFSREKINKIDPQLWQHAYNVAYAPFIENPKMSSEQEQVERFTRFYLTLFDLAKIDGGFKEAVTLAVDMIENVKTTALIEGAKETLKALKNQGYRIGIISNTWPSVDRIMQTFGLDEFVNQCSYSYQLGYSKPDVEIYNDALEKSGCLPQECVFVDDQLNNLDVAKQLGMHGVQMIYHSDVEVGEYPTITKPSELLNLLQIGI